MNKEAIKQPPAGRWTPSGSWGRCFWIHTEPKGPTKGAGYAKTGISVGNNAWRMCQGAAVSIGKLLVEAKTLLPHGAFGGWCKKNMPSYSPRRCREFMQILKTAELRRFDFSEPVFKLLGNGRELQVEKFTGDQESYTLRPARRAALSKSDIPMITTAYWSR